MQGNGACEGTGAHPQSNVRPASESGLSPTSRSKPVVCNLVKKRRASPERKADALDRSPGPEAPAASPVPSRMVLPTRRGRRKGSRERSAGATCGEEASGNPSSQPWSSRAEAPKCVLVNESFAPPGPHPSPWEHDQGFSSPFILSLSGLEYAFRLIIRIISQGQKHHRSQASSSPAIWGKK